MITVIEDITLKKARLKNFCSFLMPGLPFLPFLFYSLLIFFYGSHFCSLICPVMFTSSSCLLSSFLLGSHGDGKKWGSEYGLSHLLSKPDGSVGKESTCNAGDTGDMGSIPVSGISPGEEWQPTPVFSPGTSHGQRSLVGYNPKGWKELATTNDKAQHSITY